MPTPTFAIVILTYNRNRLLQQLLPHLEPIQRLGGEVIVVDNASSPPAEEVTRHYSWITTIRAARNFGASGRNLGFFHTKADFIVCLDDDVEGLSVDSFEKLASLFDDPSIAAVNFKVTDRDSGEIVNWVHHRTIGQWAESTFDTYEITEGAVAFRRAALAQTGGYEESFFLSHEGPDLAFRLINLGYRVIYSPAVVVQHSFASEGRTSWRNFYFDTRNAFWLAARNLPVFYGIRLVARQSAVMLVHSVRAGMLSWWVRGVYDGIAGLGKALRQRNPLDHAAMAHIRAIEQQHSSTLSRLTSRFRKGGPRIFHTQ
jgi:GT2 family glycosyltransferase